MNWKYKDSSAVATLTITWYYGGHSRDLVFRKLFGVLEESVELDYFQNNQAILFIVCGKTLVLNMGQNLDWIYDFEFRKFFIWKGPYVFVSQA